MTLALGIFKIIINIDQTSHIFKYLHLQEPIHETSIQTEICRNVFLDKSSGWKSYDEYSQRIGKF